MAKAQECLKCYECGNALIVRRTYAKGDHIQRDRECPVCRMNYVTVEQIVTSRRVDWRKPLARSPRLSTMERKKK